MSSRKRARTVRSAPRPISKSLAYVNFSAITSEQNNIVLSTAAFPCTLVGLRWELGTPMSEDSVSSSQSAFNWAIVLVKEGNVASELPTGGTQGQSFYNPEQNVLAWGSAPVTHDAGNNFADATRWDGTTKTMRKMQVGDELHLLVRTGGVTIQNNSFTGCIQFFCKT